MELVDVRTELESRLHEDGGPATRHDKTQLAVKETIASLLREHAAERGALLEVGAESGRQTVVYARQMSRPKRVVAYDWADQRADDVRDEIEFHVVDLETDRFPEDDEAFDAVVCNQVLEHLKNIFTPLSELRRVTKVGGIVIVSVPNLAALHNRVLLALGRQPTTMSLQGSHVRGYAIRSMHDLLGFNGLFAIDRVVGLGLHPFTSARIPLPLRSLCHTPVWLLRKTGRTADDWDRVRRRTWTTTRFYPDQKNPAVTGVPEVTPPS